MIANERRTPLQSAVRESRPKAGIYRIVNQRTGRVFLGSTINLGGVRNRLAFAQSSNSPGTLDRRLRADARTGDLDAFTFEVLEELEITPETTQRQIEDALATLAALWREKLQPADFY